MIKEIDIVAHNGSIVVCEALTETEKEKLKENIKSIQKTMLQRIITDNGSIVEIAKDTAYSRTEFDEIIAAWREQEYQRKQLERQQQQKNRNIFSIFKRKKAA